MVTQDCGSCHGLTMKGGLGRPLTPEALADAEPESLAGIILDGVPGTAMPPWRPLLTEDEALWMANYLKGESTMIQQTDHTSRCSHVWHSPLAVQPVRAIPAAPPAILASSSSAPRARCWSSTVRSTRLLDGSRGWAISRTPASPIRPDERHAYVFGRDGGLTKVDILTRSIVKRVVQAGNSIGGAISDDGKLVAVSNYEPGGVRVFDAETLEHGGRHSRWRQDHRSWPMCRAAVSSGACGTQARRGSRISRAEKLLLTKLADVGKNPFDAVLTDDGRTYLVGLFGEKGVTAIDLWADEPKPVRFLKDYGKTADDLPVYKMPHLQGWAFTDGQFVLPAVGRA